MRNVFWVTMDWKVISTVFYFDINYLTNTIKRLYYLLNDLNLSYSKMFRFVCNKWSSWFEKICILNIFISKLLIKYRFWLRKFFFVSQKIYCAQLYCVTVTTCRRTTWFTVTAVWKWLKAPTPWHPCATETIFLAIF